MQPHPGRPLCKFTLQLQIGSEFASRRAYSDKRTTRNGDILLQHERGQSMVMGDAGNHSVDMELVTQLCYVADDRGMFMSIANYFWTTLFGPVAL